MKNIKRLIPIIAIIIMGIILTVAVKKSGETLSVNTILRYTSQSTVLAAIIILSFFALKSLTVVFPLSILYLASGILFQPWVAVLISTAGLAITITIPYWIDRYSGEQTVQKICRKYPKAEQIVTYQETNTFFACFITRIVGFLPCDVVSLYFGACDTVYPVYLAAGISGSLLSIITTTLLGAEISNPLSLPFIIVLLCRIGVSVCAIAINCRLNRMKI